MAGDSVIYKYPLGASPGSYQVAIPANARIVHVGQQGGIVTLWANVRRTDVPTNIRFRVVPTGESFDGWYYGTVQMPLTGMVWHVIGGAMRKLRTSG